MATDVQYDQRRDYDVVDGHAKTSTAAVFGLVFGLSSLLSALTGLLAPLAIVLGIIGIILAGVGLHMSKKPLVTGHGTAVGAMILAIIGTLIGAVLVAGVVTVLNNQSAVNRIEKQLEHAKNNLPTQLPHPGK